MWSVALADPLLCDPGKGMQEALGIVVVPRIDGSHVQAVAQALEVGRAAAEVGSTRVMSRARAGSIGLRHTTSPAPMAR